MSGPVGDARSNVFQEPVRRPQGAMRQDDGSVLWRVWAPRAERVSLVTYGDGRRTEVAMTAEPFGYHSLGKRGVEEGLRYAYKLPDGEYPDPASRWQPDGIHKPSAVFFPEAFAWSDDDWTGVAREELVIYELHVGTFTAEGTFDAVAGRLDDLKSLGITAIELMPVAQFPGRRNWGYDGVHPYAVQNSYGGPRGLERLVDAAHRAGIALFLDVVYNHLGPEGNYLARFGPYFTDRYHTAWGDAVNYDGPDSDAVRQFVIDNACYWVRDFHVDGLRLDAVHAIFDFGARHILGDLQAAVRRVAADVAGTRRVPSAEAETDAAHGTRRVPATFQTEQPRIVHVFAETNQNDVRLIDPPDRGGYDLDGMWADDFHHSVRAMLTGNREGYYQDFGRPEHLAKAFQRVFVYDGCYSRFWRRRQGSPVDDRDRTRFVVYVHNHDQVGNRARGDRSPAYLTQQAQRLACGLLMLSPCIPLLFMGEEYAEARPFPFFCSFGDPDLIESVRRGRRAEFAAIEFRWGEDIPDPQDPATFESARLTWQWPDGTFHAQLRRLWADLLRARRRWPPLVDRRIASARLLNPAASERGTDWPAVLVVERGAGKSLLACANTTASCQPFPELELLDRTALLSTEEPAYGGRRDLAKPPADLHPYEMVVFGWKEWTR